MIVLMYLTLKNRKKMHASVDSGQLLFLTRLLFVTTFTYLILTLPCGVYLVAVEHIMHFYDSVDEYRGANMMWSAISSCLMYINHSINFFLYCMAGKKFRDEFKAMINCKINERKSAMELYRGTSMSTYNKTEQT